jgi:FlaA1/EpsC-like NDP-sugar epimerase
MFQKRLDFFRSILYFGDLGLVAVTWLAAYFVRFHAPIIPVTKGVPDLSLYWALLGLVMVVFAVVLQVSGLYRRPWASWGVQIWPVIRAALIGVVVSVTLTYFLRPYDFSRLVFMHFGVFVVLAMIIYCPRDQEKRSLSSAWRNWVGWWPEKSASSRCWVSGCRDF